mmetsp:Transcript_13346/g.41260  ORF Transcript_13346/g.41260 Transcript_13346/m.41260 type:complete len:301 (-) Transcript_13346:422-1324(-)
MSPQIVTGASTRCTFDSSTKISLAASQSCRTSFSSSTSHCRSCAIAASRSSIVRRRGAAASARGGGAGVEAGAQGSGTTKKNSEPWPTSDTRPISPPCSVTISRLMASPRPEPRPCCSSPGRICEKAWKRRDWSRGAMPTPRSRTETRTTCVRRPSRCSVRTRAARTVTSGASGGENLSAFETKLLTHAPRRRASPSRSDFRRSSTVPRSATPCAAAVGACVATACATRSPTSNASTWRWNAPSSIDAKLRTSSSVSDMAVMEVSTTSTTPRTSLAPETCSSASPAPDWTRTGSDGCDLT